MTDRRQQPRAEDGRDRRRYRKVFTRIWRNAEFRALTSDEKVIALYLLTGPQTNRVGLFCFSDGYASDDLDLDIPVVRSSRERICHSFEWEYDAKARVLWIPSWWVFNNPADNVNAFKGAMADLAELPSTPLLAKFAANTVGIPSHLVSYLPKVSRVVTNGVGTPSERRPDSVAIPVATQDQDQEVHPPTPLRGAVEQNLRESVAEAGATALTGPGANSTGSRSQADPWSGSDADDATSDLAARFLERLPAVYAKARDGAHFAMRPVRDRHYALDLAKTWPDVDYLLAMYELFLRKDEWRPKNVPGTPGQFRHMAPQCDAELRKHGYRRDSRAAS